MSSELILFASSFVVVFALGFQSRTVNQGHYLAAAVTSFIIGGANLILLKYGSQVSTIPEAVGYLTGGPIAIVLAIWTHKRFFGRVKK